MTMAPVRADLHTHSNRSDGVLAPAELVRQARQAGLGWLALTDHDQLAGLPEAVQAGAELGVAIIPGVELSVREPDPRTGRQLDEHLLGWFLDPATPALNAYLAELQQGRQAIAADTLRVLATLGMPVSAQRVSELAQGAVVTRPHIARAMVEAGYVATEAEAFDRWLGNGKPASVQRPAPTAAQALGVLRAAGAATGLAHPVFSQEADWQAQLALIPGRLDQLQAAGLQAVECTYPDANAEISASLLRWTTERGLIATGGSDYHGPGKAPYAPLGTAAVSDAVAQQLRQVADAG